MEINAKLLSNLANFCEKALFTQNSYTRLLYEMVIAAQWGNQSISFSIEEPMYKTAMLQKQKLEELGFIFTFKEEFGVRIVTINWEDAK